MRRSVLTCLLSLMVCWLFAASPQAGPRLKALIVDGQNNHHWQIATSIIEAILQNSGRFTVDVATSPAKGEDMSAFRPPFEGYDVVISNYNGDPWPQSTKEAFVRYVHAGNGFVVYHAANNAFPDWPEYNKMIGVGGWGGRSEKDGPYVRWRAGRVIRDGTPGVGGSHGRPHQYWIDNRAPQHPIMEGLPDRWLHSADELYDRLRGPAENLEVLATAYSDQSTGGSGEHEPVLMTIRYGKGRVFHTVLGDNLSPLFDLGFQATLSRGAEWAAAGEVTSPAPAFLLSEKKVAIRDPFTPYLKDGFGWRPLFGGKDLKGWKQVNGEATYEVIRDRGEIVGITAKGSPNSFLATVDEYADFELRFDVRLDNPELNSGVQIRSHQYQQATEVVTGGKTRHHPKGRVYGYQVEIESSQDAHLFGRDWGDAGFVYDEGRRGWLSPEDRRSDPVKRSAFQNGVWNQYHVRCSGDHIQTWVNGLKIADLHDDMTASGRIMLQVHSIPNNKGPWSVRWRNILIRELVER